MWTLLTPVTDVATAATSAALEPISASVSSCRAGLASVQATYTTNALTASAPAESIHHSEGNSQPSATATALVGYAMVKAWNRGYVGEDVRDAGLKAWDALNRDFLRGNADGTVSLARCCAVAGLSADRDGSFEYYLREPVRDNDHKGTGPYMLLAIEVEELREMPPSGGETAAR